VLGSERLGAAMRRGTPGHPLPYRQLAATYTIASLAAPLWRLLVMVCSGVGTLVAVLVLLDQGPATLGTAALPFVVAYAVAAECGRGGTGSRCWRNAPAASEAQQATAARERERIGREIHDIVAHSVSLMVVQNEAGLVLATDRNRGPARSRPPRTPGEKRSPDLDRPLGSCAANGPLSDLSGIAIMRRPGGRRPTGTGCGSNPHHRAGRGRHGRLGRPTA
jgi:hypothetical protein